MTDNESDAFAIRLAESAQATAGSPIEAAAILFQAAVAVLVATWPADAVVELLEALALDGASDLRGLLGAGETRQ